MILTGQASRAVAYAYEGSISAGASYVITQNSLVTIGSTGTLYNNANLNFEVSGDSGSNWRKSSATTSIPGFTIPCQKTYSRVRNATGGAISVAVCGVYFA